MFPPTPDSTPMEDFDFLLKNPQPKIFGWNTDIFSFQMKSFQQNLKIIHIKQKKNQKNQSYLLFPLIESLRPKWARPWFYMSLEVGHQ